MLNKLNTKVLVVILAVLVAASIYAIMSKNNTPKSTIPQHVVAYDSSQLNRLVVDTKDGEPYELVLENGSWKLSLGAKTVGIEAEALESAIATITKARPIRVVSRKEENWPNYEVNEEGATKLMFYNGDEVLAGAMIGKLDFNQQKRSMHTFIRKYDANDVYMVEGPITFDWNKQANDWRNKQLIAVNTDDIKKIDISGKSSFSLLKMEDKSWVTQGIDLDSASVEKYVAGMANITSAEFNDDISLADAGGPQLTIEVYTDTDNITITWHNVGGTDVMQSSSNTGSLFNVSPELVAKLIPMASAPAPDVAPVIPE